MAEETHAMSTDAPFVGWKGLTEVTLRKDPDKMGGSPAAGEWNTAVNTGKPQLHTANISC